MSYGLQEPDAKNDVLEKCTGYVNDWYSYYNEHIDRARNHLTFLYVDQWELSIRQARESVSRPTMQFNKLVPIIRAILGEFRNNSPELTVRAANEDTPQEKVDIQNGLIRQIQYESDADIVYQLAGKHGLECGWGAARVVAEYEDPDSFNQVLKIKPVVDFQSAFWDPTAQEPNKLDGDYCGVYEMMSMDKFKRLYPGVENPQSVAGLATNYYLRWNSRDTILVAEIYYKEYYSKKIVQLSDNNVVEASEAKEILERQESWLEMNPDALLLGFQPLEIVNEMTSRDYKIKHKKFIADQILEEADYPGRLLPIPYFEGDSVVIDGEQIPLPFITEAIDTQKMINYIGSEVAYSILRSRKETVIGTPEMFAGFEDQWKFPDRVQGYLEFNFDRDAGKPEFVTPPVFNQSFLTAYQNAGNDLMQVLGRYEEALGRETNAISGIAVNARQRASNKPVNVYDDNNQRGIQAIGKILLDMIPHIYDGERSVMIREADGATKPVKINYENGYNMLPGGDVEPRIENDMSKGKYDIEVRVDGSYDAQQAEAMQTMMTLIQALPAAGPLIADLLAENSNLENTPKLVERLKNLVPAQILAKEEGEPPPPPPPPSPKERIDMQKAQNDQVKNMLKAKDQVIEEQRVMVDAIEAGIDKETSANKAAAEIHRANADRDIAVLNHANTMNKL